MAEETSTYYTGGHKDKRSSNLSNLNSVNNKIAQTK